MNFKKNKWLIIGGIAVLGYLYFKKKNKKTSVLETAEQDVEQAVNDVVNDIENT